MKVGTDGVLVGSWVSLTGNEKHILDIGTGTGLIALMMAQRTAASTDSTMDGVNVTSGTNAAHIDAIEIEAEAAAEAALNVAVSPWKDRITVFNTSLQEFARGYDPAAAGYDLIVSNPPYFIQPTDHLDSTAKARIAARHATLLPYDELIEGVLGLLADGGRFAAIFPYGEAAVFIAKAAGAGLYCNRSLNIYPKPHRPAKRIAAEFSRIQSQSTPENLTIEKEQGRYEFTDEYKRLTGDFYLKF